MNAKLFTVLSLFALPLCAQADSRLDLQVKASTATLSSTNGEKFFGLLLAAPSKKMVDFPGLPSLLATTVVVVAGTAPGSMAIDLGKTPQIAAAQGFNIYLQGVGLIDHQIVASAVAVIGADGSK